MPWSSSEPDGSSREGLTDPGVDVFGIEDRLVRRAVTPRLDFSMQFRQVVHGFQVGLEEGCDSGELVLRELPEFADQIFSRHASYYPD